MSESKRVRRFAKAATRPALRFVAATIICLTSGAFAVSLTNDSFDIGAKPSNFGSVILVVINEDLTKFDVSVTTGLEEPGTERSQFRAETAPSGIDLMLGAYSNYPARSGQEVDVYIDLATWSRITNCSVGGEEIPVESDASIDFDDLDSKIRPALLGYSNVDASSSMSPEATGSPNAHFVHLSFRTSWHEDVGAGLVTLSCFFEPDALWTERDGTYVIKSPDLIALSSTSSSESAASSVVDIDQNTLVQTNESFYYVRGRESIGEFFGSTTWHDLEVESTPVSFDSVSGKHLDQRAVVFTSSALTARRELALIGVGTLVAVAVQFGSIALIEAWRLSAVGSKEIARRRTRRRKRDARRARRAARA